MPPVGIRSNGRLAFYSLRIALPCFPIGAPGMSRNKRSRTSRKRKKRGIVRAGASLIGRGIIRCFRIGKQDLAKSQRALVKLARARRSGQMVRFDARVVKTLPDDRDGDRHQRFLVAVDHKRSPINTVLIAHNIDLAPRIPLERGSTASFYGQYEYNERGGLLHWTHHDPSNWREGGWIEYCGKRYE